MTDREIIQLYWQRDESAIRETDVVYGSRLQALAERILNSFRDAEEMRNGTYLRAWNAIPPQQPVHFYGWLAMLCRSLSLNRLSWNKAKKRGAVVVNLSDELADILPDRRSLEQIEANELGRAINSFLKAEPEARRFLFIRRYWYMDTMEELSERFAISREKAKTDLFRMRKKLKKELEKEGWKIE